MELERAPTSGACPADEALAAFVAGTATVRESEAIEGHIDGCTHCADMLAMYGAVFAAPELPSSQLTITETSLGYVVDEGPALRAGDRFAGRYEIRSCVGFGSGGTVYAAHDSELDRLVALKILRQRDKASDTRWMREAKVMARVVHPNVVAVHDVGSADGRMFIAAEFVDGGTLERWLLATPRSWREIVEVFVAAGEGLAAIHTCGLVHRDFKPHNVMVGNDGRVRVTDFGLARASLSGSTIDDGVLVEAASLEAISLPGATMSRTRTGTLVGTPHYMSPEQWRGRVADARSDQFSFCVALYEALWRVRPFVGEAAVELAASVCEADAADPPRSDVPRWLVAIVMRGLARDPSQRFPSMRALLRELVETPRRRSARATRALLGVGALAVAAASYGAASVEHDDDCQAHATRLASVWGASARERLVAKLGDDAGPVPASIDAWAEQWRTSYADACRTLTSEDAISRRQSDLRFACLDRRLSELRAAVDVLGDVAVVGDTIGDVMDTIGSPERCVEVGRLEAIAPMWGSPASHALAAQLADDIARIEALRASGHMPEAEALARDVVARADADGDHAVRAEALTALGQVLAAGAGPREAETVLREAVWEADASGHVEIGASAWLELVNVLGNDQERYDDALAAAERVEALQVRLQDPDVAMKVASARAVILSQRGNYDEALAQHTAVLRTALANHGPEYDQLPRIHVNIAAVLTHLGRMPEAQAHAIMALELQQRLYPGEHPATAEMLNTLGGLQLHLGDREAARASLERALAMAEHTLPPTHQSIATISNNLAAIEMESGEYAAALALHQRATEIYRANFGESHPDIALALHNQAGALDKLGRVDEAIALYREALAMRNATSGPEHPGTANTLHNLGLVLVTAGQLEEGISDLERALEIRDKTKVDPFRRGSTAFMLAKAYAKRGDVGKDDPARALELARRAQASFRSIAPRHAEVAAAIDAWIAKHGAARQ